jgi:hypothetical protein
MTAAASGIVQCGSGEARATLRYEDYGIRSVTRREFRNPSENVLRKRRKSRRAYAINHCSKTLSFYELRQMCQRINWMSKNVSQDGKRLLWALN